MEPIINCFDLNFQNLDGQTVLHHESKQGRIENMSFLLRNGAKINQVDSMFYSPLCYAVKGGHLGIVEFLLERGGDCRNEQLSFPQPFLIAIETRNLSILETLFKS